MSSTADFCLKIVIIKLVQFRAVTQVIVIDLIVNLICATLYAVYKMTGSMFQQRTILKAQHNSMCHSVCHTMLEHSMNEDTHKQ